MHAGINVVEDDEDEDNVILVHYYPDEDDEINMVNNVVAIVRGLDPSAELHNN